MVLFLCPIRKYVSIFLVIHWFMSFRAGSANHFIHPTSQGDTFVYELRPLNDNPFLNTLAHNMPVFNAVSITVLCICCFLYRLAVLAMANPPHRHTAIMLRCDREATLSTEVTFLNFWPLHGATLDMTGLQGGAQEERVQKGRWVVWGKRPRKALWITATFNKI